jgi:hypothetical protein
MHAPSFRAAGALAAIVVAGAALTTVSPAQAATGSVSYLCTSPATGAFTAALDIDSAPSPVPAGSAITLTTKMTLPYAVRATLASGGAPRIDGTARLHVTVATESRQVDQTIPSTAIGSEGPLLLVASGTTTLTTSGSTRLRAGDLTATLQRRNADGTATGDPIGLSCAEPGPDPTIDRVDVTATSATMLTLNHARVDFGEKAQATARVTTTGGRAKGAVLFQLGDRTDRVWLGKDGVARSALTADLPAKASYPLTATFMPADVARVSPSSASTQVRVRKDRVNAQVRPIDARRGKRVKAWVLVRSVHGEPVTGHVRVILKRGSDELRVKTKRLQDGHRRVGLIRVWKPGRYQLRVKYLGTTNFRRSNDRVWFRIAG